MPLATIEFAILDLLGRIANKSIGQLIGDIHHPEVTVYQATEYREKSVEESLDLIKRDVAEYNAHALKIKVGGLMFMTTDINAVGPKGRTETMIPAHPEDLWRSDGVVCGCQWVLFGRGSDPRRQVAGGIPVWIF